LKCFAEFKAALLIERRVSDLKRWRGGFGSMPMTIMENLSVKPTLFRCQSQFPASQWNGSI
jgi:hypothetical protein